MNKQREEITLKDLADIFIPKAWFIVLVAVIFAGAFGGYSMFFKQNTYTSTAIYMIGKIPYSNSTSETVGLNASEVEAMQTMIENSMQIINATDFSEDVLDKILEHDIDNKKAIASIEAECKSVVDALEDEIVAKEYERTQCKLPEQSDKVNEINEEINEIKKEISEQKKHYDDRIESMRRPKITEDQIKAINSIDEDEITVGMIKGGMSVSLTGANTTCYYFNVTTEDPQLSLAIASAAGEILSERLIDTGYAIKVDCIGVPRLPSAPDSKNVVRNAIIGCLAGALLAMLAVFVISKLDVVVRSKEKLENSFNIPVIGVIPSFSDDN